MTKAVLTFEFDLPEDQDELDDVVQRRETRARVALSEFANWMRNELKHNDSTKLDESVRTKFFEVLEEHDVELW